MLRWYTERVMETNPGSIIDLVVDEETHRFKSYFLCFAACAYGYEVGCRPLIFLDGSHITDKMQGVILAASALNGNDELFTIAFAIADSETYENWKWFLNNLKKALLTERPTVFISDRAKGLKEAVPEIFPLDHHGYCLRHIKTNFMTEAAARYRKALKDSMVKTLNKVAFALNESEYVAALTEMERKSPEAKDWILRNDVEHWTNTQFPGERYMCHFDSMAKCTPNLAETFNAWIKPARGLPILQMVETICRQIMEMGGRRRIEAANWETTLCPNIEKPPITKRLPGRPRKKRIPSRGEAEHIYICSRCKQEGHNRRTFTSSLLPSFRTMRVVNI
ncbi:hypothetical protein Taro_025736 [Colocasia esculenta]|uniref:MULE transposase domain-containing protein n=1 Tax=Colocasia esculenta TaxID=4460 RepID=A0A843VD29_COLES|nr:hypothetical protein [Colocasia esculenta]